MFIAENLRTGKLRLQIAETAKYYRHLEIKGEVARIIRSCNQALGMSGNFKNGCLYREAGLSPLWRKGCGEDVVCDHAIPVTILVESFLSGTPLSELILAPVVRISKASDQTLTRMGLAKTGHKDGLPLYRYHEGKIEIITHEGHQIDPASWTNADHCALIGRTEELKPVIASLNYERGSFSP